MNENKGRSASKITDEDSMSIDGTVTTMTGSSESEKLSEQQTWNGSQWIEYYTRKYGALTAKVFQELATKRLRELYIEKYGLEAVEDSTEEAITYLNEDVTQEVENELGPEKENR